MATTTVIFDLFGTLVAAPSPSDRAAAAETLAEPASTTPTAIESYLDNSWQIRHDGTLPTVRALAAHLVASVGSPGHPDSVVETLHHLAACRLEPDQSVTIMLTRLRDADIRIGLISDASAEIAEAWPTSPLAPYVDHAVFSCTANVIKPAACLYEQVLFMLGAVPKETIYVGDGGGDELRGAQTVGVRPVRVRRRGGEHTLAYGASTEWPGPWIDSVEAIDPYGLDGLGQDRRCA